MQAIFRLCENRVGVRLEGFLVNLLAAIRGQAVHDKRVRPGELHQFGVDLIIFQRLDEN